MIRHKFPLFRATPKLNQKTHINSKSKTHEQFNTSGFAFKHPVAHILLCSDVILKKWKTLRTSPDTLKYNFLLSIMIEWWYLWYWFVVIFSQTGSEGSGKNKKSGFFLLCLKYTLRTCFELKRFWKNPVLSWAIRYSVFPRIKDNINTVKLGNKELFGHPKIVP